MNMSELLGKTHGPWLAVSVGQVPAVERGGIAFIDVQRGRVISWVFLKAHVVTTMDFASADMVAAVDGSFDGVLFAGTDAGRVRPTCVH